MIIVFVQFSGSCDTVASLMKIPQYFLPECPEADNTQVCDKETSAVTRRLRLFEISQSYNM